MMLWALLKSVTPGRLGFICGAVFGLAIGAWLLHMNGLRWGEKLTAANSETHAAQIRADLCAASVVQLNKATAAASQTGKVAQQQAAQQQQAAVIKTVTVTKYIQEAHSCSDALQRAWRSH